MTASWRHRCPGSIVDGMDTTNSTVFISGATSGLGLALAQRLQAAGSTVVIGGRRQDRLDALAAEHGFGTVAIDVADADSIAAAATDVIARYPELDTVVTMSGIMRNEDLRDRATSRTRSRPCRRTWWARSCSSTPSSPTC